MFSVVPFFSLSISLTRLFYPPFLSVFFRFFTPLLFFPPPFKIHRCTSRYVPRWRVNTMPRRLKCRGISSARKRMRFFVRYLILFFSLVILLSLPPPPPSLSLSLPRFPIFFQTYRLLYIVVRLVLCYELVMPRATEGLEGFFDESFHESLISSKLKG